MRTGLYVHVPFCESKCNYCDFYSIAPATTVERGNFLDALDVELGDLPDDFRPQTIYIGGGTPTLLGSEMLRRLLASVSGNIDAAELDEFTIEMNPGSVNEDKIAILKEAGVDRISLGVQSFDDDVLNFIGRSHSSADVYAVIGMLREAGFDDISLDLLFGVPGTDLNSTKVDVARAIAVGPEHISAYALTIAAGTRFHFLKEQGDLSELEDDLVAEQFGAVRSGLIEAGFNHYEISNFARPGRECLHNMLYWSGGSYIGCGPAAHSHWAGTRYSNLANLWAYIQAMLAGRSAEKESEMLPPDRKARETLVMWLRRLDGVDASEFRIATGFDPHQICGPEIDDLVRQGLLQERDGVLSLTEEAIFISDTVFRELV